MSGKNIEQSLRELKEYCDERRINIGWCEGCKIKEQCGVLTRNWKIDNEKKWRAKFHEDYYFVMPNINIKGDFGYLASFKAQEHGSTDDAIRYREGNYFKTPEESVEYARVLHTEALLKEYAQEHNYVSGKAYFLFYYPKKDEIHFQELFMVSAGRVIAFSSIEVAEAAIEEIGEDRIKQYLTYKW